MRETFAQMIADNYLPYTFFDRKSVRESYEAFAREYFEKKGNISFVSDKTIAKDVRMAELQIKETIKELFGKDYTLKVSLGVDGWTSPNNYK